MRKRGRGRGVHSRGGRGGPRTVANPVDSPKMINYVQIQQRPRQSPTYIRSNRGRSKDKDNRMTNLGSNGGILGNLVKAYGMSVSAEVIDGNGNAMNCDYYLHKKFKKVTTTISGEMGAAVEHFVGKNGLNGSSSDSTISKSKFSPSSSMNLVDVRKSSQDFPGALLNDFTKSMGKIKNGTLPTGTINNHKSVYKPKFRVSRAVGELDNGCPNDSTSEPISVNTTYTSHPPPARITGDRRLDRQSLDDRISKIIDENQSILSTWPEHLSKRLKSQSSRQSGGSSLLTTPSPSPTQQRVGGMNPLVMMSGGTTTEFTPGVNSSTRTFAFDVPLQSPVLDSGNSPRKKKFSFDMPPVASFPKFNLPSETGSLPSDVMCGGNGTEDLSDSSCSSSTQFVLPKKRRRLSPPPTIFCGGEVSELPVKKSSSTSLSGIGAPRNSFQDVDVTVRVSNCGPSGAKVTIRTNDSSPNVSQERVQALEFNRLIIEENGNNNSGSSSSSYKSQFLPEKRNLTFSRAPERDFFPLDLNMKSVKPRYRPPRKRKHLNGVEVETNNPVVPISTLSPSVPLELNIKSKGSDSQKYSTASPLSGAAEGFSLRNNGMMTIECGNANKSGLDFRTDREFGKQLFLQTSMPNPKRPTFLALKPSNPLPKALSDPGVLPSPETPRGAKAYNQMHINGHAYTYLGFKISTRPSYTCLFKPQPMFIPQDNDSKLSMYSNWQARPKDPNAEDCNISTNNSSVNGRKSPQFMYVSAKGKNSNTVTVNSPDSNAPLLFTPTESELTIGNMRPHDSMPSSSSNSLPLPFSSSSNFISESNEFHAQTRPKRSCHSPLDQGNSSSSSGHSNNNINKPKWSSYHGSKYQHGSSEKNAYGPGTIALSSSESSSADESNYSLSKSEFERRSFNRKNSVGTDGEDHFTMRLPSNDGKDGALPSSSRSSPDFSKFDNPRVKIMEGGFESNEDYTYIRGRGRGRYVCEACGIRCKKPSMLRKHLKTHTDLRPYSCKLCNFSFKTKGNLTKHQKSKSHHKKCLGLGIHPNSSRSLAMSGPIFDSNNTSDEDDSMDDDDDNGGESDNSNDDDGDGSPASCGDTDADHFEKEIAQSLLDLSHLSRFPRNEDTPDNNSTVNAVDEGSKQRISSFLNDFRGTPRSSKESLLVNLKSGTKMTSEKNVSKPSTSVEVEVPIDLTVKCKKDNIFPKRTNGIVKAMGIVGEAQRWEPEEAFLLNGILNLKKVRNNVIRVEEKSSEEVSPRRSEVVLPRATTPEIKVEVTESTPLVSGPAAAGSITDSFEYQIKKKCQPGSVDVNEATTTINSFQMPLSLSPTPGISTPVNNGSATSTTGCQNLKSRFHQPWLSPHGSSDETIIDSITPRRERTESLNSCITGESSNSESIGCRDEVEMIAETTASETSPVKSTVLEIAVGVCSPNSSKSLSGFASIKPQAEFRQPSGAFIKDEGKAECNICGKTFTRASQLNLHMQIHFLERPFRCDPCGVSFRTKGHLIKHRRSSSHDCKVYLTEAWGVANEENPRPFKCPDCKIAFRIHGHLAKHLRSKMHIMRMECLGKLPFGIYFEMEKSGLNLNEIDTTDCDMSLVSLQNVAKKIYGDTWMERLTLPIDDPV